MNRKPTGHHAWSSLRRGGFLSLFHNRATLTRASTTTTGTTISAMCRSQYGASIPWDRSHSSTRDTPSAYESVIRRSYTKSGRTRSILMRFDGATRPQTPAELRQSWHQSSSDRTGGGEIHFTIDGKRPAIRLGKMNGKTADTFKRHLEHLLACRTAGIGMDQHTARWLSEQPDELHGKLSRHGIVEPRVIAPDEPQPALKAFCDSYIASRTDAAARTLDNLQKSADNLVKFFGADRELDTITAGEAKDWERWLAESGGRKGGPLALNTVRGQVKKAKQFFNVAIDYELIDRNPLQKLVGNIVANKERHHFVTRDIAQRVLESCPDVTWRLIFALCRFGGLRNPSETLALRWDCIDWERNRMRVRSPKTDNHGKRFRTVPIFPELRPHLEVAFDVAPDGAEFVIDQYRSPEKNMRTRLRRIIVRAGLEPWPRLFHNLRATRETELLEEYPAHVACEWIGNTEAVAMEHYAQVTDAHFEKAIQAQRKAQQSAAESGGTAVNRSEPTHAKTRRNT